MNRNRNCEACFKFHNQTISNNCALCRDYAFHEDIICDLTRSAQQRVHNIECFAFKPNLQSIGENAPAPNTSTNGGTFEFSNHQKWLKAYALQQLEFNPDQHIVNINLHVCLVTTKREKLLENINNKLAAILSKSGKKFNSQVNLLCSGTDHLHLHISSSPAFSADTVVNSIIQDTENTLREEMPELFRNNKVLFERTYFIETIG